MHAPGATDPDPHQWPVLVTGAGGFVGGHVARHLAAAGHRVRAISRRPPHVEPADPAMEWLIGDLLDPSLRRQALAGVRGVVHSAGWVSLGHDHAGHSKSVNLDLTRQFTLESAAAGVERFVYTSTLYTLAAGTPDHPADESTPWNLDCVNAPYTRDKREAEQFVLAASRPGFTTIALCPGMVLGPRDHKPSSTKIVRMLAQSPIAIVPGGGIPIIDAAVLAIAHRRALTLGGSAERYAVVGEYQSYPSLAAHVHALTGFPRVIIPLPNWLETPLSRPTDWIAPLTRPWWPDLSRHLLAAGFLRLHVSGTKANATFDLTHPAARDTVAQSLLLI
jgi:dihydroflavonol-4-reductase